MKINKQIEESLQEIVRDKWAHDDEIGSAIGKILIPAEENFDTYAEKVFIHGIYEGLRRGERKMGDMLRSPYSEIGKLTEGLYKELKEIIEQTKENLIGRSDAWETGVKFGTLFSSVIKTEARERPQIFKSMYEWVEREHDRCVGTSFTENF